MTNGSGVTPITTNDSSITQFRTAVVNLDMATGFAGARQYQTGIVGADIAAQCAGNAAHIIGNTDQNSRRCTSVHFIETVIHHRIVRQDSVVTCGIPDRSAIEDQRIDTHTNTIAVGLPSQNGVREGQCVSAAARRVSGLHRRTPDNQCQPWRTGHGNYFRKSHRRRDHIPRIEGVVLRIRGRRKLNE